MMRSLKLTASTVVVDTASAPAEASAWHSPVPYLFGGLAVMLGLIAFALLILACSYWKLYGEEEDHCDDLERWKDEEKKKESVVYEELFTVILAGDEKPSCLAAITDSFNNNNGEKADNLKGGALHLYEQMKKSLR